MRIRSTKPEFWRSERVAQLSWDARLVLKGLESYVDDNGVGKDDIALILGDVFSRDMLANPRDTLARVSASVSELSEHGFVHRYDADGTKLLYLSWWDSNQRIDRPGKGRYPRPDGTMDYKSSEIRESVASVPRALDAPSRLEQGNRGTGEQGNSVASGSPAAPAEPEQVRPEVDELLDALDDAIQSVGHKKPARNKTAREEMRRILDIDGYTVEQTRSVIDYLPRDDFWCDNVRSAKTFRAKFDAVKGRMLKQRDRTQQPPIDRQAQILLADREQRLAREGDTQWQISQ
ncbi:hypothetical protein Bra3105_06645 [Brachybacterium halotolerans subsp. kimchii]|uniref:hypothetical protein n=1 Tax=Brachybacterium halotolerans TaxID=2795215 RepID=UPI001E305250|nr:hypothetical protein [Brachybacterium halotolerans]UEJ83985.1 hypothetical protein Bra3105_06645 [Brachybacterium halotolerans subsp. kimchii]